MHSDFWAGVSYEQCPPHVQHNLDVIGRMDAFYNAERANKAALFRYVESLFEGRSIEKPVAAKVPPIEDGEMEFMMADQIKDAAEVALILKADDAQAIAYRLALWNSECKRAEEYLAYNRKALEKRYRKGADQEEIDRVNKLITDGEAQLDLLNPRIAWGERWIPDAGRTSR